MDKMKPKKQENIKVVEKVIEKAVHCCADCTHFNWDKMSCPGKEEITLDQAYDPIECVDFLFR